MAGMPWPEGEQPERYAEYGDWGETAWQLGREATALAVGLELGRRESLDASAGPFGWSVTDTETWQCYGFVAGLMPDVRPRLREGPDDVSVDPESETELYADYNRVHAALPFTEAERYWLLDVSRLQGRLRGWPDLTCRIIGTKGTLVSAGRQQEFHGADLTRRWASWRRERDEFAGQGTLDVAIGALNRIADRIMLPRLRREAQEEAAAQYARLLSGDDPHAQEYERRQLELRSGR